MDSHENIEQPNDDLNAQVDPARLSIPGRAEEGKGGEEGHAAAAPTATTPPSPPSPPLPGRAREDAPTSGTAEVFTPAPDINPVLAVLRSRDLYRRPLEAGRHEITCPWQHQHDGNGSETTTYCEPTDTMPTGTFLCSHSHGGHLHIRELLAWLDVPTAEARGRPIIRHAAGEMNRIADCSEHVLAQEGGYYQSGNAIVTIRANPVTGQVWTEQATEQSLTRSLSALADWMKYDGRSQKWVRCDPQPRNVQMLLRAQHYAHLPALEGIARQPYFRADGSFSTAAGYDPEARTFGSFDPAAYTLPEPSEAAAREALAHLKGILEEFPFASEADRAAALCLMLTATVRSSLPFAPAFNITASGPGSGKSYLAAVAAPFAGPGDPMNISYPTTAEEATKALLAALIPKPAVILFDDMQTDWKAHGMINRVLTSRSVSDRLLGSNRTQTVSTACLFIGTGNNVAPERDMRRRVITIYLAPDSETPATLTYNGRPAELVAANREKYVACALTIIRAWQAAGSPKASVPTIATFGEWSDQCREPLIWLGEPDPASSLIQQIVADPDRDALGVLLNAWYDEFAQRAVTVRKVADAAEDRGGGGLLDAMTELPVMEREKINRSKLGWYLKKNENRIAGGLKVVKTDLAERNGWMVVPAGNNPRPAITAKPVRPVEAVWLPKVDPTDTF